MRCLVFLTSSILMFSVLIQGVRAGEIEDEIISRVTKAYGGEKLRNLKSISGVNLQFSLASTSDTSAPNEPEGMYRQLKFAFDIENNRVSNEFISSRPKGIIHQQRIFDGERAFEINYRWGTYADAKTTHSDWISRWGEMDFVFNGIPLFYDVFWVWRMSQNPELAEFQGQEFYRGVMHDKIGFSSYSGRKFTVFVNTKSNLVTKVLRIVGSGPEIIFSFGDHVKNGIIYAKKTELYVGGEFISLTINQDLIFNAAIDRSVFMVPVGVSREPERMVASSAFVSQIAEGVYHIGTGKTFSLFVDAGDYIIGIGSQKGAGGRLESFKTATGIDKPLRFQVISHHHPAYLRGIDELNQPGTSFVIVDNNIQTIRNAATDEILDERFVVVNDKLELGTVTSNAVELYEITTDNVDRYLLFYMPAHKLVYVADHLETPYAEDMPAGNRSTITFAREIERLGLDIELFVTANSPRLLTRDDLDLAVERFSTDQCLFDRSICS